MSQDAFETRFAARARAAFDDSVARLPAATRSRLAQARHAALAVGPRRGATGGWRSVAPAGGLAAAVLGGLLLWNHHGAPVVPDFLAPQVASFEDLDFMADTDALDLTDVEELEFYEWATAQEAGEEAGEVRGT